MSNKKRKFDNQSKGSSQNQFISWEKKLTNRSSNNFDTKGRSSTLSLALGSSLLATAPTKEIRTQLVSQIARILCICEVDEIVIYIDSNHELQIEKEKRFSTFFSLILQYLECPPYLRKSLFPFSPDLKFCGLANPLEIASHPAKNEKNLLYREGVVVSEAKEGGNKTMVNIGLDDTIELNFPLKKGTRVTMSLEEGNGINGSNGSKNGVPVSPNEPREKHGLYWGYSIRIANSLSDVASNCPFSNDGYDQLIACILNEDDENGQEITSEVKRDLKDSGKKHRLMFFGDIRSAVEVDEQVSQRGHNAHELFDHWLKAPLIGNGTKRLRQEEGLLIALSTLHDALH